MSAEPDPQRSDEIDLIGLLQNAWASRGLIAVSAVLSLCAGGFYLANSYPTFQADALLQLEDRQGKLGLPTGFNDLLATGSSAQTEVEIISSRLVLSRVVADLNLDWVAEPVLAPVFGIALSRYDLPLPNLPALRSFGRKGDSIELELLEVPPAWVSQEMILTVTGEDSFAIKLPNGAVMEGKVGVPLRDAAQGFALTVSSLRAPEHRQFTLRHLSERQAINRVRGGLTAAETARDSGLIELRYTATRPDFAKTVLDSVNRSYVQQNIDRSTADVEGSLTFIETQLPKAKADVEAAENALNTYRQSQQSVDLAFETSNVLTRITNIEAELRALQVKEDEIKQRYKSSHPVYQQLLVQRERLNADLETARGQVDELPETQRDILNLSAQLELTRQIYVQLQTRAQEVRVLRASTVGNVRIIDDAQPGLGKVAPKSGRVMAMAVLIGALLGMIIGILRIRLRKTVLSSEPLEQLGLPVFGTINVPKVAFLASRRRASETEVLAVSHPTDLAIEGLRSLRTSLQFGMLDSTSKSLAITSTAPAAGKSFTAVNLAVVTAQVGQRVCLVDTDLRRGQLRKRFGVAKNAIGLTEYLTGEKSLAEVLRTTEVEGLTFISTGHFPPNPSELLVRQRFNDLLAELDKRFDMVIFDCPPVLAVADPIIVGKLAGAVLAVVWFDQTPVGEVRAMLKVFEAAGVKVTGSILNGYDPKRARAHGGAQAYSYNYRYEYKSRPKDQFED